MEAQCEQPEKGPMLISVEIGHEQPFKNRELWGVISKLGKFRRGEVKFLDKWAEVHIERRLTRQMRYKRYLIVFEAEHDGRKTIIFICHPRYEPLSEGLLKFFRERGLKAIDVLGSCQVQSLATAANS